MAFQGILPLQKDQVIQTRFKLPGLKDPVEATGLVVWLNGLGKGGGLRFVELAEPSRDLIRNWVSLANPGQRMNLSERPPALQSARVQTLNPIFSYGLSPASDGAAIAPSIPVPFGVSGAIPLSDSQAVQESSGRKHSRTPFLAFGAIFSLATVALIGSASLRLSPGSAQKVTRITASRQKSSSVTVGPSAIPIGTTGADAPFSKPEIALSMALPSPGDSGKMAIPFDQSAPVHPVAVRPAAIATEQASHAKAKISRASLIALAKNVIPRPNSPSRTNDVPPPAFLPQLPSDQSPRLSVDLSTERVPAFPVAPEPANAMDKVVAAKLISRIEPVYPSVAKASRISGAVELHFTIKADGGVRNVTVTKGNTMLGHAALEAVQAWRFNPARRNGEPVEEESSTVVHFNLR